jgi:serine/threonine protein kinase
MALSAGTCLGPYEMLAPLGAGALGEVWKARDTRAAGFSEPFQRQARSVAALNHPHICRLSDVGPNYLVMEYIEGKQLAGPLPLDQTLQYAIPVAEALKATHEKGIIHGNLKPANMMITKSGGLAKISVPAEAAAAGGDTPGAIQYMAPEQLEAEECDARSDIFASLTSAITRREPRLVSGLAPATLDHIIRRCQAKIRTTVGQRQGIWCWRCA